MDLVKYIIMGVITFIVAIVIAILAKSFVAGLGFFILSNALYILWNYLNFVKKEIPPPPSGENSTKDN